MFLEGQNILPCLTNSLLIFCENLTDVLSGINKQQPICSFLVGDFNDKLSKWLPGDKDNKATQDTYPCNS